MPQQKSFTRYLASHHEDELYNAVADFVATNPDTLDLRSHRVDVDNIDSIDSIELDKVSLKTTYIQDSDTMNLEFDILVVVELIFQEITRHDDFDDSCEAWFRVTCTAYLDGSLEDFKVLEVDTYDQNKGRRFGSLLSEQLVPILYKADHDKAAEVFLRKYQPEALERPMRVNPYQLASKMGLQVVEADTCEDSTTLGQIYFQDVDGIKAGTIKIVTDLEDEFNLGAKNNTIIHECVHWALHKKAFELERCYDLGLSSISTRVDLEKCQEKTTATDWMEWHARSLTPKIMMPHDMFKQEADYIFWQYADEHGHVSSPDIIEQVIEKLADYFGVSRLSAKIRMVEVGYEEAIGAFNYVDGRYVQAHSWKKGTVEKNQTFCIDEMSAVFELFTNLEFGKLIQSGQYVYVDSHFVLSTPKYVVQDFVGRMVLTGYARHHFVLIIKYRNCSEANT